MVPALIFLAVFLVVLALLLVIAALADPARGGVQRRLRRLQRDGEAGSSGEGAERLLPQVDPVEQAVFNIPVFRGVKRRIEQSGSALKPVTFVVTVGAVSVVMFAAVYLLHGGYLAAAAALAATWYLPVFYLELRKKRRQAQFVEQLPETLHTIARSLRAGHSLSTAVELIGQEMPRPTRELFKNAFDQQQLGVRLPDALSAMTTRIESVDLHFFVTIIKLTSDSGGNLAEILEKLAETVKARLQIRRQVQSYTAEGRFSANVLLCLPVAVFAVLYYKNRAYMEVFFTVPMCQLSLVLAAVAQVVGYVIMRKIIDIRV